MTPDLNISADPYAPAQLLVHVVRGLEQYPFIASLLNFHVHKLQMRAREHQSFTPGRLNTLSQGYLEDHLQDLQFREMADKRIYNEFRALRDNPRKIAFDLIIIEPDASHKRAIDAWLLRKATVCCVDNNFEPRRNPHQQSAVVLREAIRAKAPSLVKSGAVPPTDEPVSPDKIEPRTYLTTVSLHCRLEHTTSILLDQAQPLLDRIYAAGVNAR